MVTTTTSAAPQPIFDMMVREGSASRQIDLGAAFGASGLTYKIETSGGAVETASVDANGILTIDFGGLGHSDVRVTATNALGQVTEDHFRVRVAGENTYTIAVLPDTQDYTDANLANGAPSTFYAMTEWLVANKEAHNIQFVAHVGDITQNNLSSEWDVAEQALRTLDGKIPYSLLPGNHDQALGGSAADHSSVFLDARFSPDKQRATNPGTFGGAYDQEPDSARNTYSTFTAPDGTKWLVVSLEFGPRDDVIRWAGDVIEDHLDHRVVVLSHSLTSFAGRQDPLAAPVYDEGAGYDYGMGRDPEGANDGETIHRELVERFPNVAFTFSGHIFGDGAETDVTTSQHGTQTFEMLVNYQNGISREITGNGDEALGTKGGNGAIRLVVIDPENDTVSTETYFVEFDDYLDGFRVKEELERDGLTGAYRGHQEEFANVDLSTPELRAQADAGDDIDAVAASGAETAAVELDAAKTLNPKNEAVTYRWLDADRREIATGATPTVELAQGGHKLTLEATDSAGRVTRDELRVTVTGDRTLLVEDFDDGKADGFTLPPASDPLFTTGTTGSFGLPALAGTGTQDVLEVPALDATESLLLSANLGAPAGTLLRSYSLIFDILVPAGQGTWTSLFQTDVANASDGELFIRKNGDGTGGIGIGGNYQGAFEYGAWQRVAFTFQEIGGGQSTLTKYIDGVKVGTQTVSGDRFALDVGKGALLFSDESGETSDLYVSSLLATDKVYSDAEIAALGEAKAGGIEATPPTPLSSQFDFTGGSFAPTFGAASLGGADASSTGSFLVKGTVFSRPGGGEGLAAPTGALYDQSDSENNLLVYTDAAAADWSDYTLQATLKSMDNDAIGLLFYVEDAETHYKFVMNGETNERQLVKVAGGIETVLASVASGYRFNVDMEVKIAVAGGEITVMLDGRDVFGGPVVDATRPLLGGTIGVLSSDQRSSVFDNIQVTRTALTAEAGADARIVDLDGDGKVTVALDAVSSFGPAEIVSYRWSVGGAVVATGEQAEIELGIGSAEVLLTVTDAAGKVSTDIVEIEAIARADVLLRESFSSAASLSKWTIVDEGEMGGLGPNGKSSNWVVGRNGLTQTSDLQSRQLTWDGASNPDLWKRGWSPQGDGVNVLRKGTFALYNAPDAMAWTDYSVEVTVKTEDNDALGLFFHYRDPNNYYKLELDADGVLNRDPGEANKGSFFHLIRVKDGVEELLGQVPRRYATGEAFTLRLDVEGSRIDAFIDGEAIFSRPIFDSALASGTIALYSWGSEGVSFDDVTVLRTGAAIVAAPISGTPGDDKLFTGTGNDTVYAGLGDDFVGSGAGNDSVFGGAGADKLFGGSGNDRLEGQDGDDILRGEGGDDRLLGGAGKDNLDGGAGADNLSGDAGDDVLNGGDGDDTVNGGGGTDYLSGGAGNDFLAGGEGDDTLDGGEGEDNIHGGTGNDKLQGKAGNDLLSGGAGDDLLQGGAGNDELVGGTGRNTLYGDAGDDTLVGGSGVDTLQGGDGADRLFGNTGRDLLYGGAGNDVFEFRSAADTGLGAPLRDRVFDWAAGDRIDLSAIDADATGGTSNDAFAFVGGAAFSAAGQVRFFVDAGGNTIVAANLDDNFGTTEFEIELNRTVASLAETDFVL